MSYIKVINSTEHFVNGRAFRVVCNLSFGTYNTATAMEEAIRELYNIGVLVVSAAGNEDLGACRVTPGKLIHNIVKPVHRNDMSAIAILKYFQLFKIDCINTMRKHFFIFIL